MKTTCLFVAAALLPTLALHAQNKPAYSLDFNQAAVEYHNGAAQGPAGSGVSGKPEDRAYVASAPAPSETEPQPGAIATDCELPEMEKLTLTFWYKSGDTILQDSSLLNLCGIYLIWDGKSGWTARLEATPESNFGNWIRLGTKGPVAPWTSDGEWIFGAITFNLTTKTAVVYQGTKDSAVQEQRAFSNVAISTAIKSGKIGSIGNSLTPKSNPPMPGIRPFSGSIDNISVFEKDLDLAAIEAIRVAGVENKPL